MHEVFTFKILVVVVVVVVVVSVRSLLTIYNGAPASQSRAESSRKKPGGTTRENSTPPRHTQPCQ